MSPEVVRNSSSSLKLFFPFWRTDWLSDALLYISVDLFFRFSGDPFLAEIVFGFGASIYFLGKSNIILRNSICVSRNPFQFSNFFRFTESQFGFSENASEFGNCFQFPETQFGFPESHFGFPGNSVVRKVHGLSGKLL